MSESAPSFNIDTPATSNDVDALARLRVSQSNVIFNSHFTFDNRPDSWTSSTSGGGSIVYNSNLSSVDLTLPTTSGATAVYRSRRYMTYQPGRSQFVTINALLDTAKTNVRKRVGIFDSTDGIFLEQTITELVWVVRTSTSGISDDTQRANQSVWNIDKLDGTGPSRKILDVTKIQVIVIDHGWNSSNRVRVGFYIDGDIVYAHQFLFGNTISSPYMKRGSNPVRLEITNTGTSVSTSILRLTSAQVSSESGFNPIGRIASVSNGITSKTVSTSISPVISIRLKSTAIFASITLLAHNVFVSTADDVEFTIIKNATLTGSSFTSVEATSVCEYDISATSLTGGSAAHKGYIRSANGVPFTNPQDSIYNAANIIIGSLEDGTTEILTLAIRSFQGSADVLSSLTFRENT